MIIHVLVLETSRLKFFYDLLKFDVYLYIIGVSLSNQSIRFSFVS